MAVIKTFQLAREMMKQLETYTEDIIDGMNMAGGQLALDAVKILKVTSPERKKNGGRYRKSWMVTKRTFFNAPTRFTIHNKDRYQLTHLLEKGHANRDGSRTSGRPHIGPVEETLVKEYVKQVEEVIRRGY